MATELYRPSNGTEGDFFYDRWCAHCEHEAHERCEIFTASLIHKIDEPEYPTEWVETADVAWEQRDPRCTAFVPEGQIATWPVHIRDERQHEMRF